MIEISKVCLGCKYIISVSIINLTYDYESFQFLSPWHELFNILKSLNETHVCKWYDFKPHWQLVWIVLWGCTLSPLTLRGESIACQVHQVLALAFCIPIGVSQLPWLLPVHVLLNGGIKLILSTTIKGMVAQYAFMRDVPPSLISTSFLLKGLWHLPSCSSGF